MRKQDPGKKKKPKHDSIYTKFKTTQNQAMY